MWWPAGTDRFLRWSAVVLTVGVGVHGVDHMFVRGLQASPLPVIIGGNVQAAYVVIAMVMALGRRWRAPEAVAVAGFGSAALFLYAHLMPTVWHDFSDSFVSAPHAHVSWYSWVTAVAEICAGLVAGTAGVRARRVRAEHACARVTPASPDSGKAAGAMSEERWS